MGKDATTTSAEMMRISFSTVNAKTTQTSSIGIIKVAPNQITDAKVEYAKITNPVPVTQTAVLQADGYETTNPVSISPVWSVDP